METMKRVAHAGETPLRPLPDGSSRRVLCHDGHMMAVEVHFPQGVQAALHHHPHSQISYVLSGRFRYVIGQEETVLEAGACIVVPPDAPIAALPWRRACCWTYSPPPGKISCNPNGSEKRLTRKGTFAQIILHAQRFLFYI